MAKPEAHTKPTTKNDGCSCKPYLIIGGLFFSSIFVFFLIYLNFPQLEEHERKDMKIPFSMKEAKALSKVLDRYKDTFYYTVLSTLVLAYIFLQAFAIPGSLSLSVLSGFLYPFPLAITIVCFCSATGASLCYLLSYNLGKPILYSYFPERIGAMAEKVKKERDNMFYYMLSLRVTPVFPNWLINIASPVVEVPFIPFWLGTFIGVAPPSFLAIQAGKTLHEMSNDDGKFSLISVLLLCIFSLVPLIPVFIKRYKRTKKEKQK